MHFLVTGGAGFIGSHLTEHLLDQGHSVTVLDNLSTGKREHLRTHRQLIFLEENVSTCSANTLAKGRYDGLAHLAGTPSVAHSWRQPLAAHNNTLSGTVSVIQLAQQLSIPRIVFASSAAVYGNRVPIPVAENDLAQPVSPYGLQKLTSEQYLCLFAQQFNLSAINLRLFNVFGPRQDPHSPYSGVISIFTKAMQQNADIVIHGQGQQTRDFIYVKDVAIAFSQALTAPLPFGTALTCNIGTGQAISITQLKTALQRCFPQWAGSTRYAPAKAGDIQNSRANIARAKLYLGFEPQHSIREGLITLRESLVREVELPV